MLDGKPIVADRPCVSAPYGYAPIYRETPPAKTRIRRGLNSKPGVIAIENKMW